MTSYNDKMNRARMKVERAIALLQSAHKLAYKAGEQFERETGAKGTDHAYYVWANDITDGIGRLHQRSMQPVNDIESEGNV